MSHNEPYSGPDAEFDAYLARQLDENALADQGFTRAVADRIGRHRRHRRLAFIGAVTAASVMVAIAASLSRGPILAVPDLTPRTIVATLLLVTVCSLVWIDAESRPPTRVP